MHCQVELIVGLCSRMEVLIVGSYEGARPVTGSVTDRICMIKAGRRKKERRQRLFGVDASNISCLLTQKTKLLNTLSCSQQKVHTNSLNANG